MAGFPSQCKAKEAEQAVVIRGCTAESVVVRAVPVEAAGVLETHVQVQPRPCEGIGFLKGVLPSRHYVATWDRSIEEPRFSSAH